MKKDLLSVRRMWQIFVGMSCFVGFFVSPCPADDWPRWMGPGMDGVWHETGTIDQFPETGPGVLWRQEIGSCYAGPSVVGDQLFIMDRTTDEDRAGDKVENNIKKAGRIVGDIGELMIGKLSPAGFEELDRAKLLEPTSVARGRDVVWSHPAFADGKMFVRNDRGIICVDLRKSSQP